MEGIAVLGGRDHKEEFVIGFTMLRATIGFLGSEARKNAHVREFRRKRSHLA